MSSEFGYIELTQYVCPKCGADLQEICLTTNPPQYKQQCPVCGWSSSPEKAMTAFKIKKVPFNEENNIPYVPYEPPACVNCPNHPSNGGSGICHCILGSQIFY